MATFDEVYGAIDAYAPKALSDEFCSRYSAYDNSGHLLGRKGNVRKVLAALDFSRGAVDRAIKEGAELILTHHPAIYGSISSVKEGDALGEKIVDCLENRICVVSMHLNMDCAKEGIDHYLMRGIAAAAGCQEKNVKIFSPLLEEGTGYGRGYELNGIPFHDLTENIKREFQSENVFSFGENKKIYRCASFCGAGADEGALLAAKEYGADAIVSSDFKHHIIAMAREMGLNVISLTHYASENYGFRRISQKIIEQTGLSFVYYTEEDLF